jgi:hypothetical protein
MPWDRPAFDRLIAGMVHEDAPRRFAVVQELGDMRDGRIAAWGIAWDDRVVVTDTDDRTTMILESAELAAPAFAFGADITTRLVWVDPEDTAPQR